MNAKKHRASRCSELLKLLQQRLQRQRRRQEELKSYRRLRE
jgi:hypothetical protein